MPASRRDKVISLTAVQKKGRPAKSNLMDAVRAAAQTHAYIWVLSVAGMRTKYLSEVRDLWKGSKICFGRVRVMARALGETEEEECREGVRGISKVSVR
jgi:mRNA turnover protein 4